MNTALGSPIDPAGASLEEILSKPIRSSDEDCLYRDAGMLYKGKLFLRPMSRDLGRKTEPPRQYP
jgi:hypothetical protein